MNANLTIVLVFVLAHLTGADEVRIASEGGHKKDAVNTASTRSEPAGGQTKDGALNVRDLKAEIVRQFFQCEGISADVDGDTLNRYEPEVIEKMSRMLEKKDNFVLVFKLNSEVNSLIYELLEKQVPSSEERTLQALELMVPDSEAQPTLALAKQDLRDFCQEQPSHCEQLLERVKLRLERKEFHTLDAMAFLEGAFFNWVPLGRLSKYIERFGQVSE